MLPIAARRDMGNVANVEMLPTANSNFQYGGTDVLHAANFPRAKYTFYTVGFRSLKSEV